MQNTPRGNWLTTPVALIFLAVALIISTLIFVFAGNSQSQGQTSGLSTGPATSPIAVADGSPENDQNVKRQKRVKPQYSGKGRPGLKGEKQRKSKPRISGKGMPGIKGKMQGKGKPRISGKGRPGIKGKMQGKGKPELNAEKP